MRLLVIDPEDALAPATLRGLKEEGFIVDKVSRFSKGVWMAKTNPYDLVIISCCLFNDLCSWAKDLSEEPSRAFILALTMSFSPKSKISLMESGADETIQHPCSFRELILKIKILLRREKNKNIASGSANLVLDDLTVDLSTFRVFRGGRELILRRKEFDLLHYFARNQEKIITRTEILENVWDSNTDLLTNTLEVHILNLRKKLDADCPAKKRLIHTIYGRGYLFGSRPLFGELVPTKAIALSN